MEPDSDDLILSGAIPWDVASFIQVYAGYLPFSEQLEDEYPLPPGDDLPEDAEDVALDKAAEFNAWLCETIGDNWPDLSEEAVEAHALRFVTIVNFLAAHVDRLAQDGIVDAVNADTAFSAAADPATLQGLFRLLHALCTLPFDRKRPAGGMLVPLFSYEAVVRKLRQLEADGWNPPLLADENP
jgi:hypothetical protein